MRASTEHKVWLHRDETDDWSEFKMSGAGYGLKRPMRCLPRTVTIEWHRGDGAHSPLYPGSWGLWEVNVHADRIYGSTHQGLMVYYQREVFPSEYSRTKWEEHLTRQELDPAPHDPAWAWLDALIAASHPVPKLAAVSST